MENDKLPADAKVLFLSFDPMCELDYDRARQRVEKSLADAGLGHVKVVLLSGLQHAGVLK